MSEPVPPFMQSAAPVATPRTTDVSKLLGVGTNAAWLVYGLFAVSNAAFAFATLDRVASPWPAIGALAIVNVGALLLLRWHSDPLPASWSLGIVATCIASTALVSWQLSGTGSPTYDEVWHVFANMWLLFFVALRGRAGFAWLGFLSMMGVHAWWATDVGLDVVAEMLRFQTNAGILLVASFFAAALRRVSGRINALNQRSIELASATAVARAQKETRDARISELTDVAAPLLARVASGPEMTHDDRVECLLAEATLRDGVRAPSLNMPEIVRVTTAARRRGVEVTLLDDRGGPLPSEEAMRILVVRFTEVVRGLQDGKVALRLAPAGRRVAASIVVESRGQVRRTDLDDAGDEILEAVNA